MTEQNYEHLNADQMRPGNLWACTNCGVVVLLQMIDRHTALCRGNR